MAHHHHSHARHYPFFSQSKRSDEHAYLHFHDRRQIGVPPLSVTTVVITETVFTVIESAISTDGALSDTALPALSLTLSGLISVPLALTTGTVSSSISASQSRFSLFPSPASSPPSAETPAATSATSVVPSYRFSGTPVVSSRPLSTSGSSVGNIASSLPTVSEISNITSSLAANLSSSNSLSQTLFSVPTGPKSGSDGQSGARTAAGNGQPVSTSHPLFHGPSGTTPADSKTKIVGGVVGGIAGLVLLVVAVIWLIYRRRQLIQRTPGPLPSNYNNRPPEMSEIGSEAALRSVETASRRSSRDPLFFAAGLAPIFKKRWRHSDQTTITGSTADTVTSERGFQKISGRKIPSVLQSGGDGYGSGMEDSSHGATAFSISHPSSPSGQSRSPSYQSPPTGPFGAPLDVNYTREHIESDRIAAVRRPSAASPHLASSFPIAGPHQADSSGAVGQQAVGLSSIHPRRPDALGRSHPSFDGSRGSRFTESLDI